MASLLGRIPLDKMIKIKSDALSPLISLQESKTIQFTYNYVNNNDVDDDDDLQRMYCPTCRSPLIFLITVSL